jgi:hypothetical protein
MHQLRRNRGLVQSAIKIILLLMTLTLFLPLVGWTGSFGLLACSTLIYIVSERSTQLKIDKDALGTLGKMGYSNAKAIGLSVLRKEQQLNLTKRESNCFGALYITPQGDNLLDLTKPKISTRITQIEKILTVLPT